MDIPIDPYSTEIPKDVMTFSTKSLAVRSITEMPSSKSLKSLVQATSPIVASPVLDRWDVQTHKYEKEIAVKIGFLAGLFSGSGSKVSAGVVHEAKRYRIEKSENGRTVEIGVSVRLSVATTAVKGSFELSIPNLAAQAQLGMLQARIGISVVGFVGPVGDLLPAPEDLKVENFSAFTNAAKAIQSRVFGPEGINFLAPTVLSYQEDVPNKNKG
jgi:hypothetical protein